MPNLRLTSRTLRDPLSNAETVKIGRILLANLPISHVSYPDDVEPVAVIVHGFAGPVPERVAAKLTDLLGDFDTTVEATP